MVALLRVSQGPNTCTWKSLLSIKQGTKWEVGEGGNEAFLGIPMFILSLILFIHIIQWFLDELLGKLFYSSMFLLFLIWKFSGNKSWLFPLLQVPLDSLSLPTPFHILSLSYKKLKQNKKALKIDTDFLQKASDYLIISLMSRSTSLRIMSTRT